MYVALLRGVLLRFCAIGILPYLALRVIDITQFMRCYVHIEHLSCRSETASAKRVRHRSSYSVDLLFPGARLDGRPKRPDRQTLDEEKPR
jgi:hypothetical protein